MKKYRKLIFGLLFFFGTFALSNLGWANKDFPLHYYQEIVDDDGNIIWDDCYPVTGDCVVITP
ncbi:hypothetical protein PBT90_04495 [Algoriphagus halophytocola]|uniref:hypothetical protein n=1 Tax=Algoriphagus halophytocola TaxID=2991499 RepID=UPI0022DDDD10|nr:hypothetical protein [Algoriphagus sp. TR-M9]WBL43943.1 hypothetical protein PBT90_04495 [Algoriphagus sp. TR-M9]